MLLPIGSAVELARGRGRSRGGSPVEEEMGLWRAGWVAGTTGWDGGAARHSAARRAEARRGRAGRRRGAAPAGQGGAGRAAGLVPGGSSVGEWIRRQRSGGEKGAKKKRKRKEKEEKEK
jgi:hypothetical protein